MLHGAIQKVAPFYDPWSIYVRSTSVVWMVLWTLLVRPPDIA